MQVLDWPSKSAYLARLFASHDFAITAQILTLEEHVQGQCVVLDGQVNIDTSQTVRRTASLTISDPAGALDFSNSSSWSDTSLWPDRLVRIRHHLTVNGQEVVATVFVGVPVTMSRSGAEVDVELQDKTSLAIRGSKPYTVHKGASAWQAVRNIMRDCTGERHFRLAAPPRRLSKDYSVGWDDAASPWAVASKIAHAELGMQLQYATDGYLQLRKRPTAPCITVPGVVDQASDSVDFTTVDNIVGVTGKVSTTTTQNKAKTVTTTKTSQPSTWDRLKARNRLSAETLGRNGVPRYLPLRVQEDSYTKTAQTIDRAKRELDRHGRLQDNPQFSCVPFFHLDCDDVVAFTVGGGHTRSVHLSQASIPLGVSGPMSVGEVRWVSAAPGLRSRTRILRHTKIKHPKKSKKAAAKKAASATAAKHSSKAKGGH